MRDEMPDTVPCVKHTDWWYSDVFHCFPIRAIHAIIYQYYSMQLMFQMAGRLNLRLSSSNRRFLLMQSC